MPYTPDISYPVQFYSMIYIIFLHTLYFNLHIMFITYCLSPPATI